MALYGNAAMVLYYDIAGDNADHDDWHTYEHMHERLSTPGFGNAAVSARFTPVKGSEADLSDRLAREVLPAMSSRRGMAGVHLLQPAPPPPMTKEQSMRGPDTPMTWLLLATAYDSEALSRATAEHLEPGALGRHGAAPQVDTGTYALHYTVTAQEVARTAPNPPLQPDARR